MVTVLILLASFVFVFGKDGAEVRLSALPTLTSTIHSPTSFGDLDLEFAGSEAFLLRTLRGGGAAMPAAIAGDIFTALLINASRRSRASPTAARRAASPSCHAA